MRNQLFGLAISTISLYANLTFAAHDDSTVYKDPKRSVAERTEDLLSRMTLEEKVGQLSTLLGWEMYQKYGAHIGVSDGLKEAIQKRHIGMLWATLRADPWTKKTLESGLHPRESAMATNALQRYALDSTRLGIPLLLAEECPHGHMAIGKTVFPTAIGQASTWNPQLIKQMATAIALETRSAGAHIGYGPILDLAREPRWSRVEETYGEDPLLITKMGVAMVQGFQGVNDIPSDGHIISTLKHFAAYGSPEGGHNGGSAQIGHRDMAMNYLPPFQKAVEAGALSVMTACNAIDGIPCSSNEFLLKDLLRNTWNFDGFVVSDLGSISGLLGNHHVAENAVDAAALAFNAGLDADLGGYGYDKALLEAIAQKKVSINDLDKAVARVLRLKFALGLFEDPFVDVNRAESFARSNEHVSLARKVAQESIVLLKNDEHLLPLSKNVKRIALIGPNADNTYNQLGDYTAPQDPKAIITPLQGIKEKLGPYTEINYVKGCDIRDTSNSQISEAAEAAMQSDVAIVVLGGSSARDFRTSYLATGAALVSESDISDMESGEGYDRASLDLMGKQLELFKAIVQTGKPVILVTIKGRPLNLNWAQEHVDAIIDAWYPGQEGGHAIADVLFGDYNPAGRLPISVPKSVGQLPIYYNYNKPTKHDYVEMDAKALYPFGFGLSYSDYAYSDMQTQLSLEEDDFDLSVSCTIQNIGKMAGDEVVQLYVRDKVSSVVTPVIALKDFKRIHLNAGKSTTVQFNLKKEDLKLLDNKLKWTVEKGTFQLMIGASSTDIRLEKEIELLRSYEL
ncbi:glycoside hydrolase family 3 N-terminal domain-containing protein [Olivibacter sitiensis]|uniref:glycoside hydrolase family 3 N-terminal domain-containing protein n=1 Tax=Olivibacter sitiensis TaxID=376470 RepID=UPI0003F61721|nr:glycoside hydrolase family 3 N-terminal domain-containing protein [Olivibacter sitiensis]